MDYEEAIEAIVSAKDARHEIEDQHCLCFDSFQQDVGYRETYTGREVLEWLGY